MVLPLLLVVVFGIIEFGNLWRTYQIATNAAREGAREAILPGSAETEVDSVLHNYLDNAGLDSTQATYVYNDGDPDGLCDSTSTTCPGQLEKVRVEYPFSFTVFSGVINLLCQGCGDTYGSITLKTDAVMRHE